MYAVEKSSNSDPGYADTMPLPSTRRRMEEYGNVNPMNIFPGQWMLPDNRIFQIPSWTLLRSLCSSSHGRNKRRNKKAKRGKPVVKPSSSHTPIPKEHGCSSNHKVVTEACKVTAGSKMKSKVFEPEVLHNKQASLDNRRAGKPKALSKRDKVTNQVKELDMRTFLMSGRTDFTLVIPAATLQILAAGEYRFRPTISNFVSINGTMQISFQSAFTSIPVVGVYGNGNTLPQISKGMKATSFSDEYKTDNMRVCTDITPWSQVPDGGGAKKHLVLGRHMDDVGRDTERVQLSAFMRDGTRYVVGQSEARVALKALGSPTIAKLFGPTGDVIQDVLLDASSTTLSGFVTTIRPRVQSFGVCMTKTIVASATWYYWNVLVFKRDRSEITRPYSVIIQYRSQAADDSIFIERARVLRGELTCLLGLNSNKGITLMVKPDERNTSSIDGAWRCLKIQILPDKAVKSINDPYFLYLVEAMGDLSGFVMKTGEMPMSAPTANFVQDIDVLKAVKKTTDVGLRWGGSGRMWKQYREKASVLKADKCSKPMTQNWEKEVVGASMSQIGSATIEEIDAEEYWAAQKSLGRTAESQRTETLVVGKVLDSVTTGLKASRCAAVSFSRDQCMDILSIVAHSANKRKYGNGTQLHARAQFYTKPKNAMSRCTLLACTTTTPGATPLNTGTTFKYHIPISMQFPRENPSMMAGCPLPVGFNGDGRRRSLKSLRAQPVSVTLPYDFSTKCRRCGGDSLDMSRRFLADASPHMDISGNLLRRSGALNMELPNHTNDLGMYPQPSCTMSARVPGDTSKQDESKIITCMEVEEDKAITDNNTSGSSITDYNSSTEIATCESTMLGKTSVLQCTPPTSLSSPSTPPGDIITTRDPLPGSITRKDNKKQVKATFIFGGDFTALRDSGDLMQGIIQNLAQYASVDHEDVEIRGRREGSMMLDVIIHLPSDTSEKQTMKFVKVLKQRPQEMFTDEFIQEFGIPTVEVTHPNRSDGGKDRRKKVGSIVGAIVGCLAFVVIRGWRQQ